MCSIIASHSLYSKTITDMLGRSVVLPEKLEKVFPYDTKTNIIVWPIIRQKIIATALLPGKKDFKYISKDYASIPEVDVRNIEEVLAYAPQLIIAGFYNKNDKIENALKLGEKLGIPVILIDLSIDNMDKTYLFLGTLFMVDSKPYVDYLITVYKNIERYKTASKPIDATVYFTLGSTGLTTDPSGSKHTEVFDYLKIPNAAKVDIPSGGHAQVSLEQVLLWNPDYIFTSAFKGQNSAYSTITKDTKWQSIKAVKLNKVYKIPTEPMGWFDHPPSVNRIPGILWLCEIFYNANANETQRMICKFYSLFYQYDLSIDEYHLLFN